MASSSETFLYVRNTSNLWTPSDFNLTDELINSCNGDMSIEASFTSGTNLLTSEPYLQIIEQPRARGLRFRYECEGPRAGSLLGENTTAETKTYPKVQIKNYRGPAVIVGSCVTKEPPHQPHPHSLVGKDCVNGVCTVKVDSSSDTDPAENMQVRFPQLGIQCAKKKDIEEALRVRERIRVDPFNTGFQHQAGSLDLSVICLCFQAFLWDDNTKMYSRVLPPVVSQPIYDRKAVTDLVICRIDKHSAECTGGQEMFLLCDKIAKDDIEVRFYEEDKTGRLVWEGFGEFSNNEIHKLVAIVLKIPPYRDLSISFPINVKIQLRRPSDKETSESKPFQYLPIIEDPEGIKRKRQKRLPIDVLNFSSSSIPTQSSTGLAAQSLPQFQNRTITRPVLKPVKAETGSKSCGTTNKLPSSYAAQSLPSNQPSISNTEQLFTSNTLNDTLNQPSLFSSGSSAFNENFFNLTINSQETTNDNNNSLNTFSANSSERVFQENITSFENSITPSLDLETSDSRFQQVLNNLMSERESTETSSFSANIEEIMAFLQSEDPQHFTDFQK